MNNSESANFSTMKNPPCTVHERLRVLRGHLSIGEFAQLLGVHYNTISNYEKSRKPDLPFLLRVCELTQCDRDWLVFGDGQPEADGRVDGGRAGMSQTNSIGAPIDSDDIPLFIEITKAVMQHLEKKTIKMPKAEFSGLVTKTFLSLKAFGASGAKLLNPNTTEAFVELAEKVLLETSAQH